MREYFRARRGRHNCPVCQRQFRLKYSFSYLFIFVLAMLVTAGVPAFAVYYFTERWWLALLVYVVALPLFTIPIDRWLDDTWRKSAEICAGVTESPET